MLAWMSPMYVCGCEEDGPNRAYLDLYCCKDDGSKSLKLEREKKAFPGNEENWVPRCVDEYPYMRACDDLPMLTPDVNGVGGELKKKCSDFIVTEVMGEIPRRCEAADRNYHYWLKLKRKNKTTLDVHMDLQEVLGVEKHLIGYAGLKDKRAIAVQTFSVLSFSHGLEREIELKDLDALSSRGIDVISVNKSRFKLKQCMHEGNHFEIVLADAQCGSARQMERVHSIAASIRGLGYPNYYGPQRFSKRCGLAVRGAKIIQEIADARRAGKLKLAKKLRKSTRAHPIKRFACEAFSSMLFNLWLAHRVDLGDIPRIHETGPVFGANMTRPELGTKERHLEDHILQIAGVDDLEDFPMYGFKRQAVVVPQNLSVEPDPRGLLFKFSLPRGAYATMLLREFSKLKDFCYTARGPTKIMSSSLNHTSNEDDQLLADAADDDTAAAFLQDETVVALKNDIRQKEKAHRVIPRGKPNSKYRGAYFVAKGAIAASGRRRERVILNFVKDPNSQSLDSSHPLVRRKLLAQQLLSLVERIETP